MPTMAEALQDPQALADADPAAYYDQTPFMRSVWQGRVPTWLSQAYKQDIAPAYEAWEKPWDNPDMTKAVLGTAALPAKALTGMASAFVDQGQRAMANPTVENVFPLALDMGMLGAPVSRIPGMVPKGNALLGAHVWQGGPHKYGPAPSISHNGGPPMRGSKLGAVPEGIREEYARQGHMVPNTAPIGKSGKEIGVETPYSKGLKVPKFYINELDAGLSTSSAPNMGQKKILDIADLKGRTLIPFLGDRTSREMVEAILGNRLDVPFETQGGFGYTLGNDTGAWASGQGVVSRLKNRMGEMEDPIGFSHPMAGTGSDFSHHSIDVMDRLNPVGSVPNTTDEIIRQRVNAFIMKNNEGVSKAESKLPEFLGLNNEIGRSQLMENKQLRKLFLSAIDNKDVRMLPGAPDIIPLRHSVHDEAFRNLTRGDTDPLVGQTFMDFPSGVIQTPSTHRTYEVDMGGKYPGGLEYAVPRGVLMPDVYRDYFSKGYKPHNLYKLYETQLPGQKVTDEVIDNVSTYIEDLKSRGQ